MCSICLKAVCPSGCPNADNDEIYECESCGHGIGEGEEYAEINGSYYHAECIEDMNVYELGELFGFDVEEAGLYEPEYDPDEQYVPED